VYELKFSQPPEKLCGKDRKALKRMCEFSGMSLITPVTKLGKLFSKNTVWLSLCNVIFFMIITIINVTFLTNVFAVGKIGMQICSNKQPIFWTGCL
jgi:hypothetical protein